MSVIACRVRKSPPVSCFGKLFASRLHCATVLTASSTLDARAVEVRAAVLSVAQHLVAVRVPMYGTSIYDCAFLITGECSGMTDKADSGTSGKFPEFPNEDPTKPELDRFFRVFDDKLKLTEYMSLIKETVPQSLIGLSEPIDLSEMVEEPTPNAAALLIESSKDRQGRIKFNVQCATMRRAETARDDKFKGGMTVLRDGLASIIADTMRAKAPARLRALKVAHAVGHIGQEHDGVEMYRSLLALKHVDGPTAKRSSEWHETEFWRMASEPLTDHCGVTDYLTKVNTFMEVHLPNFTRLNFQGEQLSDVYIDWMPPINASEGRVLRRELCEKRDRIAEARVRADRIVNAANKAAALAQIAIMPRGIEAPESVLIACTKIISGSADTTVEHARLAASSLPASTNAEATRRDAAVALPQDPRMGRRGENYHKIQEHQGKPR